MAPSVELGYVYGKVCSFSQNEGTFSSTESVGDFDSPPSTKIAIDPCALHRDGSGLVDGPHGKQGVVGTNTASDFVAGNKPSAALSEELPGVSEANDKERSAPMPQVHKSIADRVAMFDSPNG